MPNFEQTPEEIEATKKSEGIESEGAFDALKPFNQKLVERLKDNGMPVAATVADFVLPDSPLALLPTNRIGEGLGMVGKLGQAEKDVAGASKVAGLAGKAENAVGKSIVRDTENQAGNIGKFAGREATNLQANTLDSAYRDPEKLAQYAKNPIEAEAARKTEEKAFRDQAQKLSDLRNNIGPAGSGPTKAGGGTLDYSKMQTAEELAPKRTPDDVGQYWKQPSPGDKAPQGNLSKIEYPGSKPTATIKDLQDQMANEPDYGKQKALLQQIRDMRNNPVGSN